MIEEVTKSNYNNLLKLTNTDLAFQKNIQQTFWNSTDRIPIEFVASGVYDQLLGNSEKRIGQIQEL